MSFMRGRGAIFLSSRHAYRGRTALGGWLIVAGCWLAWTFGPATVAVGQTDADASPQRIVSVGPNATEVICALGACDRIVGVSKFCTFPPEVNERPRVGGLFDPDLERIVALQPDVVVLRGHSESLEALCADRNIRLFFDETETLRDVERSIAALGQLLGREEVAERLRKTFALRVGEIREGVANRPRPRVLVTISRQPGRVAEVMTAARGSFLSDMIELCGGTNLFAELDIPYPQVSAEAILARRPEVILELMPEAESSPVLRQAVLDDWARLGPMPAVGAGRVHVICDDHVLIPSPRYVEILERVSRLLHTEAPCGR